MKLRRPLRWVAGCSVHILMLTYICGLSSPKEQLKAEVTACDQTQANAEYTGMACEYWHGFVMRRKTWMKVGTSAGWGLEKLDHIGKLAEQSRFYREESYWRIIRIHGADRASMCAGQSSTNVRLLKTICIWNPNDVQRVENMLTWSYVSRLAKATSKS